MVFDMWPVYWNPRGWWTGVTPNYERVLRLHYFLFSNSLFWRQGIGCGGLHGLVWLSMPFDLIKSFAIFYTNSRRCYQPTASLLRESQYGSKYNAVKSQWRSINCVLDSTDGQRGMIAAVLQAAANQSIQFHRLSLSLVVYETARTASIMINNNHLRSV